jgi:hypothetical protein
MKRFLKFVFILFLIGIILFSISCKSTDVEKLLPVATITDSSKETSTESAFETKNSPPEIKNLKILPDNPSTSQDLTLTYEFNDLDKCIIKWYRNNKYGSDFDNKKVI